MTPARDDDALSWDGDDDPTLDVVAAPAPPAAVERTPAALPDGFHAVGPGSETVGRLAPDGTVTMPGARQAMTSAMLVTLGISGGALLLYTIGWIIGGLRLAGTAQFLVAPAAYQFALWLAVAAPALWFVTTLALTRRSKSWLRVVCLVAGLVLLVPWPFIMTGAVGQ